MYTRFSHLYQKGKDRTRKNLPNLRHQKKMVYINRYIDYMTSG